MKPGATVPSKTAASKVPEAVGTSAKALLSPAKLKEKAPDAYKVKFDTTRGEFTVTVTRAWAPLGADRFYNLVKHHFYDNAAFFRIRRYRLRGSTRRSRTILLRRPTSVAQSYLRRPDRIRGLRKCSSI
jgi:hypothetical protein